MKVNIPTKFIGIVLIILSILLLFVLVSYTQSIQELNQYLHKDCTLPDNICPFKRDIPWEAAMGFSIDVVIFILGILLILAPKQPELQRKPILRQKNIKAKPANLDSNERKLYETILNSDAIFQSELVEKSGMSKVKITRLLDKLEAKGLVERKRRGMTNVVIAKR